VQENMSHPLKIGDTYKCQLHFKAPITFESKQGLDDNNLESLQWSTHSKKYYINNKIKIGPPPHESVRQVLGDFLWKTKVKGPHDCRR
jgi:hypothetical protein